MNPKLVTLVAFVTLMGCQLVSAATLEQAQLAVEELHNLTLLLKTNISTEIAAEIPFLELQLSNQLTSTLEEIDNQAAEVLEKISTLVNNVWTNADLNPAICRLNAEADVESFVANIKKRLDQCHDVMLNAVTERLGSSLSDAQRQSDQSYQCTNMALTQCAQYDKDQDCFEFVITSVGFIKTRMLTSMGSLRAKVRNQVTELDFPCFRTIKEAAVFYPDVILNGVATCVDSFIPQLIGNYC